MAFFVQRIQGSIGYVEYAYAKQNKISHALMQNKEGVFVAPAANASGAEPLEKENLMRNILQRYASVKFFSNMGTTFKNEFLKMPA